MLIKERKSRNKDQNAGNNYWSSIATLLGFANKAGKLKFGFSACYQSCVKKKAKLVLITHDLSDHTIRKLKSIIDQNRIKTITYGTKEQFGLLFNRSDIGLISVEDPDFASGIEKIFA
ncbi:MAG: ribosomal L7Ae/L30e/S12e/Gadd45 family protein [Candidatus Cloacimonetes bacterium]|nr:ribosomal L7Ae/L30e/S12e/Gadd45 family protein [Candidatus Cloacimonadota bacterium]